MQKTPPKNAPADKPSYLPLIFLVLYFIVTGLFIFGHELLESEFEGTGKMDNSAISTQKAETIHGFLIGGYFGATVLVLAIMMHHYRRREKRIHHLLTEVHDSRDVLRESEEKFHSIFDAINDAIFIHDMDTGRILDVNQKMCELYGCTPEEARNATASDFSLGEPPYDDAHASALIQKAASGESQFFEWHARDRAGRPFWTDVKLKRAKVGKKDRLLAIVRDISERKEAEEALRKSEEKYRGVFHESVTAVYLFDENKNFIDSNPAGLELLGYAREELLCMRIPDVDADPQAVLPAHKQLLTGGKLINYEHKLKRKDGKIITVLNNSRPLMDNEGRVMGMLSTLIDITEQKKIQEALHEKDRFQEALLNDMLTFVGILKPDGDIIFINNTPLEVGGLNLADIKGQKFYDAPWWTHSAEVHETVKRDVAECAAGKSMVHDIQIRTGDGTLMWIEYSMHPVYGEDGNVQFLIPEGRDITARKRTEEQLRESQKLEVVGQLAGGVAHDFNNLLQAIKGYTDLAMDHLDEVHPAHDCISEIAAAGDRAAMLVRQMLAFSRRQVLDMKRIDLNMVVANLMAMIKRVIGEHVTLQIQPGNNLAHVRADPGQIEQILLNLCVNARDAMPEGGLITIKTDCVELDEAFCRENKWAETGSYVLLTIGDTGNGMDPDTLKCIFEPFFTTKEVGKGTGLGLSMVYGLIKQHKGFLHVSSEKGKGTAFDIYLPQVPHAPMEAAPPAAEAPPIGNETILLAEDDATVLKLTRSMLEQAGYHVIAAVDGEDAVNLFNQHIDTIDMALLDVMMPKLSGKAAYRKMRKKRPDMRFLFASGYSMNAIHTNFVLEKGLTLLQKPYDYNILLRLIRETLDKKKTAGITGARILLVEDDQQALNLFRKILESAGHEVTVADNGKKAHEQLAQKSFDMVITDIIMPESDGLETIMNLFQKCPDMKVIAISGGGRCKAGDYLEVAKSFGASAALEKPIAPQVLIDTVNSLLAENTPAT